MEPAHDQITECEALLQENAGPLEGRNDGWGFIEAGHASITIAHRANLIETSM